jgi:hypothetical protein
VILAQQLDADSVLVLLHAAATFERMALVSA